MASSGQLVAPQPFVPLEDGAQVEVTGHLFGEIVETRLWFRSRQPPITPLQLQDLANGVATWYLTQVLPNLSSELYVDYVRATDWTSFPPPYVFDSFAPGAGGIITGCHSANVAVRVSFKGTSDQTFPNNSNFVPAIPLERVSGNTYDGIIKDVLFDAYVSLIDLAAGFGSFPAWEWVITSRQLNKAYRSTQEWSRTDFIRFPSPYVSPRRKRLPK